MLTGGGDCPGLNAVIRAVTRRAIAEQFNVLGFRNGWAGVIRSDYFPLTRERVTGILHQGGTIIGTARCDEFRTREGRKIAALNLMQHGIDGLIVIGGDGSLTGADLFRREWPSLVNELAQDGTISAEEASAHQRLLIVGMVGSIDNDFSGTDMTFQHITVDRNPHCNVCGTPPAIT